MLNWVLGNKTKRKPNAKKKKKKPLGKKPDYEAAKQIAAAGSVDERATLARHEDLEPEILYYFATDEAPEVRREVAENIGTPLQADIILAEDEDEEVRCELAGKIGRLVPELTPKENDRLVEMAMDVVEILARDELPRVRAIIAEELKSATNVPPEIVRGLAEDLEDIVAVPILEYSPMLGELDLLEIIEKGLKGDKLLAVARRHDIPEPVVDAVVATEDTVAVSTVVQNESANISDQTFGQIAELAEHDDECQKAMVYRSDLPVRVILRIASFVNAALMENLIERHGEQKELVDELRQTVRDRIERGELAGEDLPFETASERAEREFQEGILNENRLISAIDEGDYAYVRFGIFHLADVPAHKGNEILNSGSPNSVVSLGWKAGLEMSTTERVQEKVCKFGAGKLLRAKPDGSYPLSDDDMTFYLEGFLAE